MPTCPNGHQSGSDDWCEVCGHRMAGPGAPAGAVPPPPPPAYGYPGPGDPNATAQAELCPQCRTPREAMAPFCEECRYNFLTHTATSYTPVAPPQQQPAGLNLPPGFQSQPAPAPAPPPPAPQPPLPQQHDPYEYQSSRPSQMNRPAEPLTNDPSAQQPPQAFQQPGQQQPQAFQQPGPPPPPSFQHPQPSQQGPPPPSFQQQPAPPVPQQPQQTGGGDDWMLPPPSQAPQQPQAPQLPQPQAPQQPHAPQAFQQQMPQQYAQQPGPQSGPQLGSQLGSQQGQPGPQQPPQYQPQPQAPAGWTAVIAPDREYFLAMMQRSGPDASGLNLPAYSPEQHLPLVGNQITIGRRRHSTGESPDIDLSVPPEDPGVSHQHAVLVQQPDGSWAVVDQNSTNGTTLNGAEDPIQPYVPIPLNDGDRVHVGAWTTITVRRG